MTTSADLGISYLAAQQAQPEITHNTALNMLQIMQTGVISVALNTPPGSPTQGDTYILGASPTGVWAGRANCLAGYFGTGWVFVPGNDSSGAAIAMGARHEGLKVWSKADNAFYIWSGSAWAALATGMSNPMTTSQDLIVGGSSGTPGRLAIGTNGYVLTAVAGAVAWAVATGFANPMTTAGDIILGGASGAPGRLGIGSTGQVLTVSGGTAVWAANAAMNNPMTTSGDIIYGGASGVPTRLAVGTNGYVLTLTAGVPTWAAAAAGMTNPMTTAGDLILGGASGAPGRLAIGTNGYVLTVVGGTAAWAAAAAGMTNPMTTLGDIIKGGSSGTPGRLAVGTTGQVLTVVSGEAAWATPSGGSPGTPPTIVQTGISNAASTSITLGSAPINGHLLVAICQAGAATAGSGWTVQASTSAGSFYGVVVTKVAGASESATQTPIATAGSGPVIMMWELSGAAASPVIIAEAASKNATNVSSTVVPSMVNTLALFGMSVESSGVSLTGKFNYTESNSVTSGYNASMGYANASSAVFGGIWKLASAANCRPSYIVVTA